MPIDPLGKAAASQIPLPFSPPKTGFASQPSEHQELPLNLHDLIVKHEHGVFYFRAAGPPFDVLRIYAGDIVVVDRVVAVGVGNMVVAIDHDEFIIRWVEKRKNEWLLVTDDDKDAPIPILEPSMIFGVVTHVIHEVARRARKEEHDEAGGSGGRG